MPALTDLTELTAPERFRFTTPVLWQQKNGETAAPPNDANATNAVTVDPYVVGNFKEMLEV